MDYANLPGACGDLSWENVSPSMRLRLTLHYIQIYVNANIVVRSVLSACVCARECVCLCLRARVHVRVRVRVCICEHNWSTTDSKACVAQLL